MTITGVAQPARLPPYDMDMLLDEPRRDTAI